MTLVPKGPRASTAATVTDIGSKRQRGRPGGLGYDPEDSTEHAGPTYAEDGETNVFEVVGRRGYSEDRFYVRSLNKHDHGQHVSIRFPQGIDSQLDAMVREVPEYRHRNDLVRDAIVHRLEYLQRRYKTTPEARRFLELERLRADSDRRAQDILTMQETVRDLEDKLKGAWDAADYSMFAEEIKEGEELLDWMREPYQAQVKQVLANWKARGRTEIAKVEQQRDE